jgi:uncharacterized protein (TIGR03083 family)
MTTTVLEPPRTATLPRPVAMQLAAAEYQRFADLLRRLGPDDWVTPTECPGWDVRAMAAHALGMVEMAASVREQRRQTKLARRRGGVFLDALTALQVEERAGLAPDRLVDLYARRGAKAAAARRRTPAFIRRRAIPIPQLVGDREEQWTVGFLLDVILTRDPWMHRVDIARATGVENVLTAEHDGVLVADVVEEWAARHGRPFTLRLTGPAGGQWQRGAGGPELELDAVEFCRALSGRAPATGLLATQVPF